MIEFRQKGDFSKLEKYLLKSKKFRPKILDKYGKAGVAALASATPVDSGLTASSWSYEIIEDDNGFAIRFNNSNVKQGYANVAVILQYGHGTGTGGWVEGRDYINPAIQPIFENIAQAAWEEVTKV